MARRPKGWKIQLGCLLIISIITASECTLSACNNYQVLSDVTRSIHNFSYTGTSFCDNGLAIGWYRFMGEAGTHLPEQPVDNRFGQPFACHTHAVSWLTSPHPRFGEGNVSRTVCFSWSGTTCFSPPVAISVINCGGYYVYYLPTVPNCQYRYCANNTIVSKGSKTKVSCLDNYMGIELNRIFYKVSTFENMTLRSKNCTAVINATKIVLGSKLNSCGTTREENGTHIVYRNEAILAAKTEGNLIARDHDAVIPFSCAYKKDGYANTVSFIPNARVNVSEAHIGKFSFELEMHQDSSYNSPYRSYPVNVALQDQLYFQVKASAEDNGLVLLIDKCFSTPNANRNDHRKYTFINNGCIVDNTARFHSADHLKQRFSMSAFRYLTNYTTIYIHCLVLLCQRSSNDPRCLSGCQGNNVNRGRRDISTEMKSTNGERSYSAYYLLDQGPITLKGGKQASSKNVSHSSIKAAIVSLAVGMAAMVMIVAALIIIMRRRRSQAETNCKEEVGIDNPTLSK